MNRHPHPLGPSPSQILASLIAEEPKALDEATRAVGMGLITLSEDWMREATINRRLAEEWAQGPEGRA